MIHVPWLRHGLLEHKSYTVKEYTHVTYITGKLFSVVVTIDCIKYDVTIQKPALQHGVCERVRDGVRTCAVESKPGMPCAACFIDVHTRLDPHTVCPTRWRL